MHFENDAGNFVDDPNVVVYLHASLVITVCFMCTYYDCLLRQDLIFGEDKLIMKTVKFMPLERDLYTHFKQSNHKLIKQLATIILALKLYGNSNHL